MSNGEVAERIYQKMQEKGFDISREEILEKVWLCDVASQFEKKSIIDWEEFLKIYFIIRDVEKNKFRREF